MQYLLLLSGKDALVNFKAITNRIENQNRHLWLDWNYSLKCSPLQQFFVAEETYSSPLPGVIF